MMDVNGSKGELLKEKGRQVRVDGKTKRDRLHQMLEVKVLTE
jgi:hypothetical protein